MSFKKYIKQTWLRVLVVFAILTFLAIFFLGQQYYVSRNFDREFYFVQMLFYELSYFYTWGPLLLLIIGLANRFRLERKMWGRNLSLHLTAGIIIALLHRTISLLAHVLINAPNKLNEASITLLYNKIISGSFDSFLIYWLILAGYYSFDYYRQFREHKIMAAQLEAQLAQAQLQALKMQLQPHFLFNTLHAISALMDEDVKAARRMLARLSDLLRQTLDHIGVQEVSLSQELEFLKSYLEIEQTRFQDRLRIFYRISPDVLEASVPNLILQPLVENAIKHGITPRAAGGTIHIAAWQAQEQLYLKISDNGTGTGKEIQSCENQGLGITTTRKRLQQLYGSAYSFEIQQSVESGCQVIISIPFKIKSQ